MSPSKDASAPVESVQVSPYPWSTQLLPPKYFVRRRALGVLCVWGVIVFTLLTATCAVLAPVCLRGQRIRASNSELIAKAEPLENLRMEAALMSTNNRQQEQWNDWVESAKPDDSLLQTLGVIARSTNPAETGIEIESLHIQLPLEDPSGQSQPSRWAAAHLSITANVENPVVAHSWIERLGASDRITDPRSRDSRAKFAPGSWTGGSVHVIARPESTRIVP